tara:strand:- start:559 stop:726 length:168 start_codon:yes stop_codon:yes gene_type:complete
MHRGKKAGKSFVTGFSLGLLLFSGSFLGICQFNLPNSKAKDNLKLEHADGSIEAY